MATGTEIRWLELVAPMSPRFIESEGKWAVAYNNEFDREIERFDTREEAASFCNANQNPDEAELAEKMDAGGIHALLAKLRPLREPDTLYMTATMRAKITEALKPTLVAKTDQPGARYAGMDIYCYPAGTIVWNKKTDQRAVIDENTVLSAIRADVVIVEPRRALDEASHG
jgi:hypothetical protein